VCESVFPTQSILLVGMSGFGDISSVWKINSKSVGGIFRQHVQKYASVCVCVCSRQQPVYTNDRTWRRSENVTICLCGMGAAPSSIRCKSHPGVRSASLASFGNRLLLLLLLLESGRTITHRLRPSFFANWMRVWE